MPADKANHFVYGAVLACLGAVIHSPVAGMALCLTLALGKEIRDRVSRRGNPEVADAAATIFGGAVVVIPCLSTWTKL